MKTDPQTVEPSAPAPECSVDSLLSSFPMRGHVRIPRDLSRGIAVLCMVLSLTLVLGGILLSFGGASFRRKAPSSPAPMPTPSESLPAASDTTAVTPPIHSGATYPFADGPDGSALFPSIGGLDAVDPSLIGSSHVALADVSGGRLVAGVGADELIYPASLTKVMTLIVAVENLPHESSLTDTVTISQEVYDHMVSEGASGIGFDPGEKLTVEALLYALMLQSDGMAACELARYVAGSEEAFVALMNQKAASMSLTATHFENPTGLHHPEHKSTARELASIMAYAMKMKLCRTIMTTELYKAPFTMATGEQKTYLFYNGLLVTQFDRVTPNQPDALTVIAGKTGYTPESGRCLVTYAESSDGKAYVCVTANAANYTGCIADYITVYNTYAKP